jgi:hypothetical protein
LELLEFFRVGWEHKKMIENSQVLMEFWKLDQWELGLIRAEDWDWV